MWTLGNASAWSDGVREFVRRNVNHSRLADIGSRIAVVPKRVRRRH
jgi:hypothetical protein